MKRIKLLLYIVPFLLTIILLDACSPTRPEIIKVDPGFNEYISGYTSGMIYRKDVIRIELADDVPGLDKYSQKKLNELFQIEPAIAGNAIAINERVIEFVPKEVLPVNQFYTVNFDLDEITEVKSGFEEFIFQFATFQQKMKVEFRGLRNYNSYQIEYQKLEGSIATTDFEDTTLLRQTLSIELDGKEIPFRLRYEGYGNKVKFFADSIRRLTKERALIIKWDGLPINSFSKGEEVIKVSSLTDFSVSNVSLIENEDQSIEITFTEPILASQNLNGIISLQGVDELSYKINFNVVTVYLPNRFIGDKKLKISTGIKNVAGYKMAKSFSKEITFHEPYPLVRIKGSGSILPNSQGLIFPFEAIALEAVKVRVIRIYENNVHHFLQVNDLDGDDELTRFGKIIAEKKLDLTKDKSKNMKQWNTHIIDLGKLINAEPGAIYQVALKFEKSYAICDCGDSDEDEEETEIDDVQEDWNENQWHTYGFDGYSTWSYHNDNAESPCDQAYYYGKAVRRNILASNIGMIFKLDEDKTSHAFLSDMVSTAPISNATVSYYDYAKKLIATTTTDIQGMAKVKLKQKPFLMIAKKGNQRGYLKLKDGRANSLSKFDVSGEVVQKGVKGFIYADRGVWRPGDSIYVNFILQDKLKSLPSNHPVTFELEDPNGNIIYQVSKSKHLNGIYDFRTSTSQDAPTGNYRATVEVGNKTYRKTFKVETIQPNRLKVSLDVKKGKSVDSCTLTAKWLHGANAKNLKAQVQVSLNPMKTSFKGYDKYVFDSPIRNGRSDKSTVYSGNLDAEGQASFVSKLFTSSEASGMLQATYFTKVYEKGGNFSIDQKVSAFSPFETYVGLKTPAESVYDNTLETDKTHRFELASVGNSGETVSGVSINVRLYKLDWDWWYDGSNAEDLASFTSRSSALILKDTVIRTTKGKGIFNLRLAASEYGKFLIIATDKDGGHQTGKVIHVDWPYWSRANRSDNEFATMLSFSTDKTKYIKGEKIKLSFPSPSAGRALVSVETSEKVIKKFWIQTRKGETTHEFLATEDMAPNAFLHVTLIQPHNATKNDLPIRMYGVLPVEVDDPYTHLNPLIVMKDKIRPESKASIQIKEKNGRKMTYTLAIVDDGLLDITAFGTPQPWNTFYAKEALGVKTWDMYDDVIGAFGGKLNHMLSVGGDGSAIVGNGPKANRFKPMVKYIGPFELPAGGSRNHLIDIPNYVGSVRVMVVARDKESYGNAQKTVVVKKPLMVLATVPRVLGPGEEFELPVDVFAMEKHVKNVNIKIEVNGMFELLDNKQKTIQFNAEGDEIVNFRIKTKQKLGVGKIKIIAVSGKETATQEIEVDIRPSNPVVYSVQEFQLESGKSANAQIKLDGIIGTNKATIEVSTLPSINLEKRMGYLVHYPHGCVEQTTSAVFPQLYLSAMTQLSAKEKLEISTNIKAGIQRLQLFQTSHGGFSYWPGESSDSEWGTNYAGHFILEAELVGYRLPVNMKSNWVSYQKEKAQNWSQNGSYSSREYESAQLTQAYRLYLLALSNSPEIGAMNRLREEKSLSATAKWRLASAYQLVGQSEAAERLIKNTPIKVAQYKELSYTFGSDLRDRAIILEALSGTRDKSKGIEMLKYIAGELRSDRWMSTQETAYSLLAIAKYCKVSSDASVSKMSYTLNGGSTLAISIGSKIETIRLSESKGQSQSLSFKNLGSGPLFVSVITEKIPIKDNMKKEFSKLEMSIAYKDADGKEIKINELTQGTEFIAEITLTNPSKTVYLKEMALNQIFPSGWEIHNSRLYGSQGYENKVRYQDIRDDRVLSYYSLNPGETKTISILLNATYMGKFYLPGIYSEAMYDHGIHAQIPGSWVVVKK